MLFGCGYTSVNNAHRSEADLERKSINPAF